MKVKFLFVLSFLAIGAAAVLSNCTKENQPTENQTVANPRGGGCDITIQTNGNLEICGTQTNTTSCAPGVVGLVNVAAGTTTYSIVPPAQLRLTNVLGSNPSDAIQIKIGPSGQLGQVHYINDGDTKAFNITAACEVQ